jgi:hypothetical protein
MSGAFLLDELWSATSSVLTAVLPLAGLFLLFQVLLLRLPRRDFRNIATGTLLSATGLLLFLLGVGIGFLPAGRAIGEALGGLSNKWLLLPAGLFLGFVTTWGEPAVRILADQVEDASNGSIRRSLVLYTICVGVALWVGLGLLRIGYGIPILYLLVPGYLLVIAVMWMSDRDFVGIAVDAGGVATGPLANTFLLALALGASSAVGGQSPLVNGLGLVSLIALAPVLSLLVLGMLIRRRKTR